MSKWKQKLRHKNHYNNTAYLYNILYEEEQGAKIKIALGNLKIRKQDYVLDLGCGTGLLLLEIQETAEMIVGIDVSRSMLEKAKFSLGQTTNIHLIMADADYTPLKKKCFDKVFAITLLQNLPDPVNTLQEMMRVTKPSSSIIITGLKKYFKEGSFLKLLENAKMQIDLAKTGEESKGYVAMCRKKHC